MAFSVRRGMDWPTSWRALTPLYGLAAGLHAFFPAFAVPAWAIFVIYGLKVLDGAKRAEDPWEGKRNPKAYLITFVPILMIHLAAFTSGLIGAGDTVASAGAYLALASTLVLALGCAAGFVAASAPPSVRGERFLVRLGVLAGIGTALLNPVILGPFLLLSADASVDLLLVSILLAIVSVLLFTRADRVAQRRTTIVARKLPRP